MSDPQPSPQRLIEDERPAAGALREFAERTALNPGEPQAWDRLNRTRPGPRPTLWWAMAAAVVCLAAFVAWQVGRRPSSVTNEGGRSPPVDRATTVTDRISLRDDPVALTPPVVQLDEDAIVELTRSTHARARAGSGGVEVQLEEGELRLSVKPRPADRAFQVSAGPYRFAVLGTVFRVAASSTRVELWVSQGTVEVASGPQVLARVEAGGQWTGPLELPAAPIAPARSATPKATAPPGVESQLQPCADRLRQSQPAEAVRCYRAVAKGDGLGAQTACYEVGRLERDSLKDDRAALQTFSGCRARFPTSPLLPEIELSMVELLPRVGRFREALQQSEKLLERSPTGERAGQLRLLRGNIYREALGDCDNAEREYQLSIDAGGHSSEEALFLHAYCLESLGERERAAEELRRYLRSGAQPRKREALERLEKMKGP